MKLADIVTTEYGTINGNVQEEIICEKDSAVGILLDAFDTYQEWKQQAHSLQTDICSYIIQDKMPKPYSVKDIETVSNILGNLSSGKGSFSNTAGVFLTKLILMHKIRNQTSQDLAHPPLYKINTTKFAKNIFSYIPYFGRNMSFTNIEVTGDLGEEAFGFSENCNFVVYGSTHSETGKNMKNCSLIIKGNTRNFVGREIKNSNIVVEGDALDGVGNCMHSGEIIIYGNAGKNVGLNAYGGIITLFGDYESLAPYTKAQIYHKGERIR